MKTFKTFIEIVGLMLTLIFMLGGVLSPLFIGHWICFVWLILDILLVCYLCALGIEHGKKLNNQNSTCLNNNKV